MYLNSVCVIYYSTYSVPFSKTFSLADYLYFSKRKPTNMRRQQNANLLLRLEYFPTPNVDPTVKLRHISCISSVYASLEFGSCKNSQKSLYCVGNKAHLSIAKTHLPTIASNVRTGVLEL